MESPSISMASSPTKTPMVVVEMAPYSEPTNVSETKKGGICCGCCCDYRRAVIIVSTIVCFLEFFILIAFASGYFFTVDGCDSDAFKDHMAGYRWTEVALSAISVVVGLACIAGAVSYNVWPVLVNAIWLLVGWIIALVVAAQSCSSWEDKESKYSKCECEINVPAIPFALLLIGLFMYPHIMFFVEVKKGIMTAETYERENVVASRSRLRYRKRQITNNSLC